MRVFWLDTDFIINQLRQKAEQFIRDTWVHKVVLFGSLAEGRAVPGSDADILIVVEDDSRPMNERIDEYLEFFSGIGIGIEKARGNAPVSPPSSCSSSLSECISRNGALDFLMKREETDPDVSDGIVGRFNRCECARLLGMEITDTWPGGARVTMDATGKRNSNGVIHGGAIFSLADHAFGLAANNGGTRQVAVSASISYLSPARGTLEAVAKLVDETADRSVFVVRVYEGERLVATFEGVGVKVQRG